MFNMPIAMLVALALGQASAARTSWMYYPDGTNSHDGMSATIDFGNDTLRVAGALHDMEHCAGKTQLCIRSGYMTVIVPDEAVPAGVACGVRFERTGQADLVQSGQVRTIGVVRSTQGPATFEFYLDENAALLGWTLAYEGQAGHREETYLVEGAEFVPGRDAQRSVP